MFDAHILVLHPGRRIQSLDQNLVQARSDHDFTRLRARAAHRRNAPQLPLHILGVDGGIALEALEKPGNQPVLLPDQGQEQMLHIHLLVSEARCNGLRLGHSLL